MTDYRAVVVLAGKGILLSVCGIVTTLALLASPFVAMGIWFLYDFMSRR